MTYKTLNEVLKCALVLYVPLSLLTPILMYQWRDNNRLIVMDNAHSYHVTEYSTEETLRRLYEYQMKQAVFAFLTRNPNGFDNAELLDVMFSGNARLEVEKQFLQEAEQFKNYKIHQKPEVLNIRILRMDRRRSFARAEGQLIRHYVTANGVMQTFSADFELHVEMEVNYDTSTTNRYPFVITNLKYNQNEHKEN